jgi:RNA polymerase sigma-70 factor (ECF subfamily)
MGAGERDTDIFRSLRANYGFVPALFRAQAGDPRAIEVQSRLLTELVGREGLLSRLQKECILLSCAAAARCDYWVSLQCQTLQLLGVPERQLDAIVIDPGSAGLSPATVALLEFARAISADAANAQPLETKALLAEGASPTACIEAIAIAAVARFFCVLATSLASPPDFGARIVDDIPALKQQSAPREFAAHVPALPQPLATRLATLFGFVPNAFSMLSPLPEIASGMADLTESILASGSLTDRVKWLILLSSAAAVRNDCLASAYAHCLDNIGVSDGDMTAILFQAEPTALSEHELKFAAFARTVDSSAIDRLPDGIRAEVARVISLSHALNVLQRGLRAPPDFPLRWSFESGPENILNLMPDEPRPNRVEAEPDRDLDEVRRVLQGDLNAFETLVERHGKRVYRTLIGLLGSDDEARDAMQDTFLKAFQHIDTFQHRAKFSTWLVSIATNTGLQRLRERRHFESIDETGGEGDESFRPRQIRAWTPDPEKMYSDVEMRSLVERGVMSLPAKYRVVVMLRDIEQLPIEDTAAALGLGIPAIKSRLLRGRLMLREALAPHFIASGESRAGRGVPA